MDKSESISKIQKLLHAIPKTTEDFTDSEIELIKLGHNRATYSISTKNNKRYVIKKGNDNKDLGAVNLTDVKVQTFLRQMGCDFVPEIIYWDKSQDFHIESYVGNQDIDFNDLNEAELTTFAKQLTLVHSFTIEQYTDFCKQNNFEKPEVSSPIDHLNIYGFDRFDIAKKLCTDTKVIEWLDYNLRQNLKILQSKNASSNTPHLRWGDIGENLRKDKDKLYFIDWEFSELGYNSELSYIKIHSHLSLEKFNLLVSLYEKYSPEVKTHKEILESINFSERLTRVNDVVWADMKWGQSELTEDIEKYKELTYKRIGLAESLINQ